MLTDAAAIVAAYVLGSIPIAGLVVRRRAHLDLRRVGSGNVGATNALRATTPAIGLLVALADAAKGAVAVWLARRTQASDGAVALAAVASVVGHVAPIWLRFRGGKGVATASGAFALLGAVAAAAAVVVFIAVVWSTRLVSLGSLVAALALVGTAAWHEPTFVKEAAAVTRVVLKPRQHQPAARRHRAPAGHQIFMHHRRSRGRQLGHRAGRAPGAPDTTCACEAGTRLVASRRDARQRRLSAGRRSSRASIPPPRSGRRRRCHAGGGRGTVAACAAYRAVARPAAVPFISAAKGLEHARSPDVAGDRRRGQASPAVAVLSGRPSRRRLRRAADGRRWRRVRQAARPSANSADRRCGYATDDVASVEIGG